jgi:hypothetical protein
MAWNDAAWQTGWLALDRNGNGTIDDFTELFSNVTPQPASDTPNGFAALAVFDSRDHGGNADGVIDGSDTIHARLRVWIDASHNGVSEPNELHSLQEVGIQRIGLRYHRTPFTDQYGNAFRYVGPVGTILDTAGICVMTFSFRCSQAHECFG